jgi:hypothetical protein
VSKASEEKQERVGRRRGDEASGSPPTPAEEESSVHRPETKPDYMSDVDDTMRERLKELNPDDFE